MSEWLVTDFHKHSRTKEHIHVAVAVKRLDTSEPVPGVSTYFHIWGLRSEVSDVQLAIRP
jgi:hypothetical protein